MLAPRPRPVTPVPTRPLLVLLLTAFLLLTALPIAQVRASSPLAPPPHNAPATQVKAVAVGWEHACVVMRTGAVHCWGNNESGQTAVPADLGPVVQVSTGFHHTCAVTTAGAVRCWGDSSETNIPADLGPVSQVSAGFRYTCAVTTATMLRCWGRTAGTIVPADLGPVSQVSVGLTIATEGGTACAVTTAGTVRCWSDPSSRDIVNFHMPKDLGPISQVSAGNDNACAMGTGGSLRCWGDGASTAPADLGLISQVNVGFSVSGDVTCVVTTARSLRCWGGVNNHLPADLGSVSQVSAGEYGTCAVTTVGSLRCWNSDGEIQLDPAVAGGGATSGNGATTSATGLVYSAGGQQYRVDANRSTAIGAAPPTGSILGPGNTRLWIETADPWQQNSFDDHQPFQILQASRDGSNRQVLLDSNTFYKQFPKLVSLNFRHYGERLFPRLVINAHATQVFFVACNQFMGESAVCQFLQLDLASHTVSSVNELSNTGTYPGWINPDGQHAIYSWDVACNGTLYVRDSRTTLSGTPISAVWLSDTSFVYSRYICKGVWTEGNITPQYDIILAHADGSDNRVLVPGKVASAMALAPDQQTLAFITSDPGKLQSGEVALWVVSLDGTGLHKVMDLPKDAADLRWDEASVGAGTGTEQATPTPPLAPTTGEIAYVQDRNIYLLDLASRKTIPLVTDGTVGSPDEWRGGIQLTWSPDGRRLAYASNRAGNYDIYTLDIASRKSERVSTDPLDEYLPSFAPDGTLFFVRITKAHVHNNIVGEWKLIRVTTSGLQTVVTTDTYVVDKIDALSHDEMLIITSGDMGWGSLSTGKKDVIWNNDNYNCAWPGGGQSTFDAAWSHDGTTLAVIAADCPKGDTSGNWRTAIFLTDAANPNAEPRRLLSDQYGFSTLDWSPDAAWLVYEGGTDKEKGLWLVSAKGGTPQRIADVGTRPAWRPTVTGGDQAQATVVPTASSQPTATTPAGQVHATLSGVVTDEYGHPIEGAFVWGEHCKHSPSTFTDSKGNYKLDLFGVDDTCTIRLYKESFLDPISGLIPRFFDPPWYLIHQPLQSATQNFTLKSGNRPLIFVPGIMGSELTEVAESGSPLQLRWPDLTNGEWRLSLDPKDNVNANIIATDALRWVPTRPMFNVYGEFIDKLVNEGRYTEYGVLPISQDTPLDVCHEIPAIPTLFVFAYDWRKSNRENAQLLARYVKCIQEIYGENTGVNIVAHSMGGLVTREYIRQHPEDHYVDKAVTIATPWLGAPQAILALETGHLSPITPILIPPEDLKNLAEYFPGVHELLPNRSYFAQNSEADKVTFGEECTEQGSVCDYNNDRQQNGSYTYDQFDAALNARYSHDKYNLDSPGIANRKFHDELSRMAWFSPYHTVNNFHIYGVQSHDVTIGGVTTRYEKICKDVAGTEVPTTMEFLTLVNCQYIYRLSGNDTRGDETVPLMSAFGGKGNNDVTNSKLFYAPMQTNFLGVQERDDKAVAHNGLMANPEVITTIIERLSYREVPPPPSSGQRSPEGVYFSAFSSQMDTQPQLPEPLPAYYVSFTNVTSVSVSDGLGNITDAVSGTLGMLVPNVTYRRMGATAHDVILPIGQPYTITLPLGPEPVVIQARVGTGETTTKLVRYQDLTLPLTTTAMLAISPQGIADLRYDSDGNGSFDATVPPTVSVSGDRASDVGPPAVTIAVAKQSGLWLATITAEDTGSGVKRVLYATDDQHYQVYTAPFEVNPNEVPTLYAFADDNVANRSGVVTYTLVRDEPWGWPGYVLLALGALVLAGGAFVSSRRTPPPAQRRWLVLAVIAGGAALVILAVFVVFPGLVGPQPRPTVPVAAPTPASEAIAPAVASPPALPTNPPTMTTATAPAGASPPALPTNPSALAPTVTLVAAFVPSSVTEPSATSVRTLPTAQATQVPTLAPTVTLAATTRPASSPITAMRSCSLTLVGGFGIIWRSSSAMQQRIGCPTQAERGGQIAEQPYERGSMFYYDPLRLVYALAGGERGTWRVYEQDRLMSQPTPTPAAPPPGLIAPLHGFGLVWGTQAWARNALGWGTHNEDGPFDGAAQLFEHGTMLFSPMGLGRGNVLYVLYDDGTFERYDDPNH